MFYDIFYHSYTTTTKQEKIIATNLENVLATKNQYGCFLEDFGLENGSGYISSENIDNIKQQIEQNIASYETRVNVIDVTFIGNEQNIFSLIFKIQCQVKEDQKIYSFLFDFFQGTVS